MLWTIALQSHAARRFAWTAAVDGRRVLIRSGRALILVDTNPAPVRASVMP